MRTSQEGFQQSYNAQLAVDEDTQLIVGNSATNSHNDQGLLHPMLDKVSKTFDDTPKEVYADAGYANEKGLSKLEERGIEGYVATSKNNQTKRKINSEKHPATHRMAAKLKTEKGQKKYQTRSWVSEAPFGWIKRGMGFKQFQDHLMILFPAPQ